MTTTRPALRTHGAALRAVLTFTVLLGVVYPAVILGVTQVALPWQANGSIVTDADGTAVGSSLLGQSFTDAEGAALPEWFQSRPSAVGNDAGGSGGSNLGPHSSDLVASIEERRAAGAVTPDGLTASASGLDPHISPENAYAQVATVAQARGLTEASVRAVVDAAVQGRDLGFLGEQRVNVLELNRALAARE